MIGLIKKDLLMLRANLKISVVLALAVIFFCLPGNLQGSMIVIPMLGIMMFLSTFSYDEFNNWNAYAITLPGAKKDIVKAKYISTYIIMVVLFIMTLLITLIIVRLTELNMTNDEILANFIAAIFGTSLVVALLYPFMIKFGAVNGRIIIFAFIIGLGILGYVISAFLDENLIKEFIDSFENLTYIGIYILSLLCLLISYFISKSIYVKKEF